MLGRLKMTNQEALEQYNSFAEEVFSSKNKKSFLQDGAFKASTLETLMKKVVAKYSQPSNPNALMLTSDAVGASCVLCRIF